MDSPADGELVYKGIVTNPAGEEVMLVGFNLTRVLTPYSER
jgi:hypothetical protein